MDNSENDLAELAQLLGITADELVTAAGGHWSRVSDDGEDRTWLGGESGQDVLISVSGGECRVAAPGGVWRGVHRVTYEARAPSVTLALEGDDLRARLAAAAKAAATARRATFRRCAECGERLPPELMHERALCMGCAQRYHGVVY